MSISYTPKTLLFRLTTAVKERRVTLGFDSLTVLKFRALKFHVSSQLMNSVSGHWVCRDVS